MTLHSSLQSSTSRLIYLKVNQCCSVFSWLCKLHAKDAHDKVHRTGFYRLPARTETIQPLVALVLILHMRLGLTSSCNLRLRGVMYRQPAAYNGDSLGFQGGDCEQYDLQGCDAVWSATSVLNSRKNIWLVHEGCTFLWKFGNLYKTIQFNIPHVGDFPLHTTRFKYTCVY